MIMRFLNVRAFPQKGDPELDWFYVGKKRDTTLSSKQQGQLYLISNCHSRKFTKLEREYFQAVVKALEVLMKNPPVDWDWQEAQGLPPYILRFKAISLGALKSPRDVAPIKGAPLFYDMRGAGDKNSIQSLVALTSGLSEGFQRIFEDQECLNWYLQFLQHHLMVAAE